MGVLPWTKGRLREDEKLSFRGLEIISRPTELLRIAWVARHFFLECFFMRLYA